MDPLNKKKKSKLAYKNPEDALAYGKRYREAHRVEMKEKRKPFEYIHIPNIRKHDIGDISEAKLLGRFLERGYVVSKPFSGHCRYDFILENDEGQLLKVQCKTGRLRANSVRFSVATPSGNGEPGRTKDYKGQIDFFAVYCPDNDGYYFVPIDAITTKSEFSLRVRPPIRDTNPGSNVIDAEPFII